MFRVTIRPINTNDENVFEFQFSLGDAVHCLATAYSPQTTDRLVAAQGWVKCVGLSRGSFLKNQLGAPAKIIEACTSAKGVLEWHDLTPAPRFLCPPDGGETTYWVLDNLVDAWLISVTRLPARVQPA